MNVHPSLMYGAFQRSLQGTSTSGSREDIRVPCVCFGIPSITKYHLKAFLLASRGPSTLQMKINLAPFFFLSPIQKAGASLSQNYIFQPTFFINATSFGFFKHDFLSFFWSTFQILFLIPVKNFSFMIILIKQSIQQKPFSSE